ncbi:MAG: ABC transporter permease [Anaerolineales bacterium]
MLRPRWRKVWADLWSSKIRTVLVVLSIAVGVFAVGTVGGSYIVLSRTFSVGYLAANPAHAHLFMSSFNDDIVNIARRTPGVADAEARRSLSLTIKLADGETRNLTIIIIPDLAESGIEMLRVEQGPAIPSQRGLLVERTSLPLTGAELGETITVELGDGRTREFKLEGVAYNATNAPATFSNAVEAYATPATLDWLGEERWYDQLFITVADDPMNEAHIREVATRVQERIEKTGDYQVFFINVPVPGQHPAYQVIQSLLVLLGVMGVFSLFLSGFLVVNILSGLLAQHVRYIGMMKAVGARTSQVAWMYIVLVLGFGMLAFLVAAPLATLASYALCTAFAGWINFDLVGFEMPPAVLLVMAVISLVVPVLAAMVPVWRGARMTVREAISSYGLGKGAFGRSWLDRVLERVRVFSRPVLISIRNTFRRKTRLVLTLVTLTVAGAIFIAVFNVRESLTTAINGMLDSFLSDVNLSLGSVQDIDEVSELALAIPGVKAVEGWTGAAGKVLDADDQALENFTVIGVPAGSQLIKPVIEQGRWLVAGDENAVVVGTDYISKFPETKPGDTLRAELNGRKVDLQVVGVMRMLSAGGGSYIGYSSFDYMARISGGGHRSTEYRIALEQSDLESQKRVAEALQRNFEARKIKATAQTGAEFKDQVSQAVSIIVAFLAPMAVMVGLVGALGLMGTMSLNVIERTREIGVLRAVGASNRKVFQIVVVEGLIIGLLSWALGILLALPISAGLALIVGQIFQANLQPVMSLPGFLIWLAVVLVLSWFASLLPAWNAMRLTGRDVLAYE